MRSGAHPRVHCKLEEQEGRARGWYGVLFVRKCTAEEHMHAHMCVGLSFCMKTTVWDWFAALMSVPVAVSTSHKQFVGLHEKVPIEDFEGKVQLQSLESIASRL